MRTRADESPQLIPMPGNGRPPCGCDEWAQRRKVAPNDDICEGRRVHTRGHNDSHPALDETTTTPHSTINLDANGDGKGKGKGEEGQRQGQQAVRRRSQAVGQRSRPT